MALKNLFFIGMTLAIFLLASSAGAVIVDISALTNCPSDNAVQVPLTAGNWVVTPIDPSGGGAYTAWNAWNGNVSGCDTSGDNCTNGWLTTYRIFSADVPDDGFGGGTWQTPELAFQNNSEGTSFTLGSDQTVSFYIRDSNCDDNVGGVSLDVSQAVPTLPNARVFGALLAILTIVALLVLRSSYRSPRVDGTA